MVPLLVCKPSSLVLRHYEPRSTGELLADPRAVERMGTAFDQQIQRNTGGKRSAKDVRLEAPYLNAPTSPEEALATVMSGDGWKYASNSKSETSGDYQIAINPNLDESVFLHELGHVAARQGRVGSLVRSVRDNPQLMKALSQAFHCSDEPCGSYSWRR